MFLEIQKKTEIKLSWLKDAQYDKHHRTIFPIQESGCKVFPIKERGCEDIIFSIIVLGVPFCVYVCV